MRPRLTSEEIAFLTRTLQAYALLMEQKEKEMEQRELKIERLRREVYHTGDRQTLEELKRERQQYAIDKKQNYSSQSLVVKVLLKRFEGLTSGRKFHSAMLTRIFLKE